MNTFFKPAISFMGKLKFYQKFLMILVIFLCSIILLLTVIFFDANKDINFTNNEIKGLAYINEVIPLLNNVQQHRGLSSSYLGGNSGAKDNMLSIQSEIFDQIESINKIEKELDGLFYSAELWEEIKRDWEFIQQEVDSFSRSVSFEAHTNLISKIIKLNLQIQTYSNLLLDPEITTSFFADSISNKLPWISEYMGQARGLGTGILSSKTINTEERTNLIFLSRVLSNYLNEIESSKEIVFKQSDLDLSNIELQSYSVIEASNRLIAIINNEILNSTSLDMDSLEYFNFTTEIINEVYTLIEMESLLLEKLLLERIDALVVKEYTFLGINIVILLIILYFFMGLYLGVRNTIFSIGRVTEDIASGDLTKRVDIEIKDETKLIVESINQMADSFNSMIKNNLILSEEVSAASEELSAITEETKCTITQVASAVQQMASGADSQLKGTEETAQAIEELARGVQHIAMNSSHVAEVAIEAATVAESGNTSIQKTVSQMNSISTSVTQSSHIIKELGERSKNIQNIVDVITNIASQTNLLALNAAIEAARAGEHGKGFAVVSEEVRKLAEEAESSANQISSLIKGISEDSLKSIKAMDVVTSNVESGLMVVNESGDAFNQILAAIQQVSTQIQEISATSEEMSASAEEITAIVEQVTDIARESMLGTQSVAASSEQQLASMEEVADASSALTEKSQGLQELISRFKIK